MFGKNPKINIFTPDIGMARNFADDYARGIEEQNRNLERIISIMGRPMKSVEDPMSPMDFVDEADDKQFAEHKWRGNFSYDVIANRCGGTVWVGLNKIDYLKSVGGKCDFFFQFSDGLYKAVYEEEFHTYPTQYHARNRADKRNDGSVVINIPVSKLVLV